MTSTTPKGHAPATKPYRLANKQPRAKASVKARCRRSSAYITIMKVTATTPNAVVRRPSFRPSVPTVVRVMPECRSDRLDGLSSEKDQENEHRDILRPPPAGEQI